LTIHHTVEAHPDTSLPDPHQDHYSKTILGFWIYLMTDCILFATFFATYAVLHTNTFGGPGPKDLFSLDLAFSETMLLLLSSLTSGFAVLANKNSKTIAWLFLTALFGSMFLALELYEFHHFISIGANFTKSAFLSSFFALVGTHGLHITAGLLWIAVMIAQLFYYGINKETFRRLVVFVMFWHFLDLIWIFIFTFVYLLGVG